MIVFILLFLQSVCVAVGDLRPVVVPIVIFLRSSPFTGELIDIFLMIIINKMEYNILFL